MANLKPKPTFVADPEGAVITSEKQTFKMEVLTRDVNTPFVLAFLPDGRLLITERNGALRILDKTGLASKTPVRVGDVNVTTRVGSQPAGETKRRGCARSIIGARDACNPSKRSHNSAQCHESDKMIAGIGHGILVTELIGHGVNGVTGDYSRGGAEYWFNRKHLPRIIRILAIEKWHIEAEGKLYRQSASMNLRVSSGIDWFELRGDVDFDGQSASLPDVLSALLPSVFRFDSGAHSMQHVEESRPGCVETHVREAQLAGVREERQGNEERRG